MIKSVSHIVITTNDVEKMTDFFSKIFEIKPCYTNNLFSEFILESKFRVAFFKPVKANKKLFSASLSRKTLSIGVTVKNVDENFKRVKTLSKSLNLKIVSKPKNHAWGFRSFLLIDPDKNRWEITQSPTKTGMLKEIKLAKKS